MRSRELFEQYRQNKERVLMCSREIQARRMDLMPSKASSLSLAPSKPSGYSSSLENTAVKISEDAEIRRLEKIKQKAELDIQTVQSLMGLMDFPARKIFELRYLKGKRVAEIAVGLGYSERELYRMFSQTFQRLDSIHGTP